MINIPYHLILASNSPRRRELLTGLGINYEIRIISNIEENYPNNLSPQEIPLYLAAQKAKPYILSDNELLITADTIVILNGEVLGKPKDENEARIMLKKLSGRTHSVITGVALTSLTKQNTFKVTTEVTFKQLSNEEINYYISNYQPLDKAGAYGIQEWIGFIGVTSIKGSFYNVMGLPVQRIYEEIVNF